MQNKLTRKASWEDMYRKHRNNVKNEVVLMYSKKIYRVGQWVLTSFNCSILVKYSIQSNESNFILFNIKIIFICY